MAEAFAILLLIKIIDKIITVSFLGLFIFLYMKYIIHVKNQEIKTKM